MELKNKIYNFNLRGVNMSEELTCPVCGIKQINSNFYFDFTLKSKDPKPSTSDTVYSRVCQYAKKPGCINQIGKLDETLQIQNTLPEWDSVTKHYMKSITDYPD